MITWVIGRGGLLGRAVSARIARERERWGTEYAPGPVPWSEPNEARELLRLQARGLEEAAQGRPWSVIWAAGAATTSTGREAAFAELDTLTVVAEALRGALPSGPGAFFLTSSAGGVFAGSANPPFSIGSEPRPLGAYGELKLAQEDAVRHLLGSRCPIAIGRVSNLYGPGQNLDKMQGLISRLALSAVTRQPANIFVSLDTIRDYIFTDDAAEAVLHAVRMAAETETDRMDVIASGQPATVGQLIRLMDQVAKRRVPVALGSHPSSRAQSLDLRLLPSIRVADPTPLPAGMKRVYLDVLQRVQQESLLERAPASAS